jgi:hypothetical protein
VVATRGAVQVDFSADWLVPRAGKWPFAKSCYLRVPALNGYDATRAALRLDGEVFPSHAFTHVSLERPVRDSFGSNATVGQVDIDGVRVLSDESTPRPSAESLAGPLWTCRDQSFTVGLDSAGNPRGRSSDPTVPALPDQAGDRDGKRTEPSLGLLGRSQAKRSGCAAVAAVEERGFESDRDLQLLIFGAVFGMAGAAMVASLRRLGWRKAR